MEKAGVDRALAYSAVGSPDTVRRRLQAFIAAARPDEFMATALIFDHAARLRSFEILADIGRDVAALTPAASGA
jgi:alkanesulfonate monooxygenase SsuD/methylene tetrahydromethanopterin reductase-like flavin-dependent oxidoreductase (luciferase family)